MKITVLCSNRAPGLVPVLNRHERRGADHEIVCCVTSAGTFAEEVRVERRAVSPRRPLDIARAGRWTLAPGGTLTGDSILAGV